MPQGGNAPFAGGSVSVNDAGTVANYLRRSQPDRPLTAEELAQRRREAKRWRVIKWTLIVSLCFPPAGLFVLSVVLIRKASRPRGIVARLVLLILLLPIGAWFWVAAATSLWQGRLIDVPAAILVALAATLGATRYIPWPANPRSRTKPLQGEEIA